MTTDRIPLRTALTAGVWATPRPLPTADRCGHTPDQHRHLDGLEADLRTARRDARELRADRDQARQLADFRQGVNDSLRQDLSDAGDVIAAIRDAAERLDRVLAGRLPSLPDIRAAVEHIDRALAAYDTVPAGRDGGGTPGSAPDHAQGEPIRPADWEQRAIDAAGNALGDAWHWLANDPASRTRLATAAVRAIIDAGLAGAGGRCRRCGSTFPRTLPAGQDPICWTCDSEEQTGLDEYATPADSPA